MNVHDESVEADEHTSAIHGWLLADDGDLADVPQAQFRTAIENGISPRR
jgi:hypothetical protein